MACFVRYWTNCPLIIFYRWHKSLAPGYKNNIRDIRWMFFTQMVTEYIYLRACTITPYAYHEHKFKGWVTWNTMNRRLYVCATVYYTFIELDNPSYLLWKRFCLVNPMRFWGFIPGLFSITFYMLFIIRRNYSVRVLVYTFFVTPIHQRPYTAIVVSLFVQSLDTFHQNLEPRDLALCSQYEADELVILDRSPVLVHSWSSVLELWSSTGPGFRAGRVIGIWDTVVIGLAICEWSGTQTISALRLDRLPGHLGPHIESEPLTERVFPYICHQILWARLLDPVVETDVCSASKQRLGRRPNIQPTPGQYAHARHSQSCIYSCVETWKHYLFHCWERLYDGPTFVCIRYGTKVRTLRLAYMMLRRHFSYDRVRYWTW